MPPLEGWRRVKVTDLHAAADYAQMLKELSDVHFPAGLLIGVANHRRDVQPQHDRPCRDWDKPARAATVFIHNGAPSALVGCLEARAWAKDADADAIGNALAGLHAKYVMWLGDEAGDYPDAIMPTFEGIFAGEPAEAHIAIAGNPT